MQRQMKLYVEQIDELQTEIGHLKIQSANSLQHWKTIEVLFENDKASENVKTRAENCSNKEIQAQTGMSICLNQIRLLNDLFYRNYRQMYQHRCNGRYFKKGERDR